MPERNTIAAYLEAVQEQIRWKRARPVLTRELERHLEDQRDAFVQEGKAPEEAERLAVEDMGDPVAVGTELDRVHRPRPQWGLLGLTLALAAAGAFLRVEFLRTSPYSTGPQVLIKALASLAALALGTAAMLGMYFLDVSRLVRHARAVSIAALAVGLASLLFSAGRMLFFVEAQGTAYYTQYVLPFYPLAYALWLYSWRGKRWKGLFLVILGGALLSAVCCLTPSMLGLVTLLFSGLALTLYAAGRDWFGVGRRKGVAAVLAVPAVLLVWLLSQGYLHSFLGRLKIALNHELDPQNQGFMGWMLHMFWKDVPPLRRHESFGAALQVGARVRVYTDGTNLFGDTLPIDYSHDLLPVSMAVEWGWVPLLVLLGALTALLLWLLMKGLRQSYLPGRFVVLAVTLTLGLQTLFSAALNFGFVLFSAGLPLIVGSFQTVVDMALIGLALSVFRGESIAREAPVGPLPPRKRLRVRIEYQ